MTEQHLRSTTSLCTTCKRSVPAEVWRVGSRVVLRKRCAEHGAQEAPVAADAAWYEETMQHAATLRRPEGARPAERGCPFDCGPCTQHEQRLHLPIVPITSACNLDCPICYTHNRNGPDAFHMSEAQLRSILHHLRQALPDKRIINITGGEPTQHPQFERLLELCREEGIHRITVSTHGLRFLKDEHLLERLRELDARVILSFDSFKPEVNREMLGGALLPAKLRILDLLEKHDLDTTLLPVLAKGSNDDEVGAFVRLALDKDFIRSVELHTMTFTGQSGAAFDKRGRYLPDEVLVDLERTTGGLLRKSDFVPSPAAHPLCYQVTYLLRLGDGSWLPFPRFMERRDLREMLAGMLYLEPGPELEGRLQDVINRLWAGEIACDDPDTVLAALKSLVDRMFAPGVSAEQRLRVAERSTKAVYVHAHMDEETFDTDRIRQCCVGIREPDGSNVPSCSYNVLYRERDTRFMSEPQPALVTLGQGRFVAKA